MSSREWLFRLEEIISALERIQLYIQNLNMHQFELDQRTIDAVIRNLEIIGRLPVIFLAPLHNNIHPFPGDI